MLNNSAVPEDESEVNGCWEWRAGINQAKPLDYRRRKAYPLLSVRVDGRHFTLKVHRLMLCWLEANDADAPEMVFDLYWHRSAAGFEADHNGCRNGLCINPDHLQWLHIDEHRVITRERGEGIWR